MGDSFRAPSFTKITWFFCFWVLFVLNRPAFELVMKGSVVKWSRPGICPGAELLGFQLLSAVELVGRLSSAFIFPLMPGSHHSASSFPKRLQTSFVAHGDLNPIINTTLPFAFSFNYNERPFLHTLELRVLILMLLYADGMLQTRDSSYFYLACAGR